MEIIGKERQELYSKISNNILNNKLVLIHGEVGIGKTFLINKFCNEYKYNIITMNNLPQLNAKNISEFLYTQLKTDDIIEFFKEKEKKILLLDEYHNLLDEEKELQTILLSLIKDNKELKMPIVIIMNYNIKFSFVKYKKLFNIYYYPKILVEDIYIFITKLYINDKELLYKKFNKKFTLKDKNLKKYEKDLISQFIVECFYDLNILQLNINIITYIYYYYTHSKNKKQYIKDNSKDLLKKNRLINIQINEIIKNFFNDIFDIKDLYDTNNDFLLYSILEHIPHELLLYRTTDSLLNNKKYIIKILDCILKINDNYCDYSSEIEIENLLYIKNCLILNLIKKFKINSLKFSNEEHENYHINYKPSNQCLKNMQYNNKIKQLKDLIENSHINNKNIVSKSYNIYHINFLNNLMDNSILTEDNYDNNDNSNGNNINYNNKNDNNDNDNDNDNDNNDNNNDNDNDNSIILNNKYYPNILKYKNLFNI
jgi:archaellum biogenesis ATPase FlaH